MDGDVDEEEAESADVVVDVEERSSNVVRSNLLILEGAVLYYKPLHCNPALALAEKMAFQRALWHEVRRC